jgi:hypothetical protein
VRFAYRRERGLFAAWGLVLAHRGLGPDRGHEQPWTEHLEAALLVAA